MQTYITIVSPALLIMPGVPEDKNATDQTRKQAVDQGIEALESKHRFVNQHP